MTDPVPGSSAAAARGHAVDPAVATAYRHLHADAVRALESWTPPDPGQARLRAGYLEHLADHPDGVAKGGPSTHLTASCLVLDTTAEHVLLTLHKRAGEWFQLGGHLEAGDATLWEAARREAREESGLGDLDPLPTPVQLDRHVLVGAFGRCREHLDVRYAAVASPGTEARVSEESHDVRWWPVDDLPAGTRVELAPLVSAARRAVLAG